MSEATPADVREVERRPLSVVVFGNSAGVLVAGTEGEQPPYLSYPAALARESRGGRRFEVTNACRIAGILPDISGAWMEPLARIRPDVVVLQFGAYDAFPLWLPRRLIAYCMGITRHPGKLRDAYWHRMAKLLATLSEAEGRLDDHLPPGRGGYVSPQRYERELRSICRRISRQVGCRIVLMDAYHVASLSVLNNEHTHIRMTLNNEVIRRVAADLGLEVFPLAKLVESLDPEVALGDGMHPTAAAHRRIGEELATFLASTSD